MTRPRHDDRELARDVSSALTEFLARKIDRVALAGRLRRAALAAERGPVLVPPAQSKADEHAAAFDEVFAYWQKRMGHPQSKATKERRAKVIARLRDKYSVTQIKLAISGCAASPFHMGENDQRTRYDDLTLICRSATKLEEFLRIAAERVPSGSADRVVDPERARLEHEADRALAEGRTEDYNATQERLHRAG